MKIDIIINILINSDFNIKYKLFELKIELVIQGATFTK